MKIGILTFHCAHNYGAVLQCYALQETLKSLGHEVEVIDYRPKYLILPYKRFDRKWFYRKNILKILKRVSSEIRLYNIRKNRYNNFNKFIAEKLELSDRITNNVIPDTYDYYIIGSDQVWNKKITWGFDPIFWGQFKHSASSKVITYAASMEATRINEEDQSIIRTLLDNFNHISVREEALKQILCNISNKNIKVVLDPTLIADTKIWDNIIEYPQIDRKYILIYQYSKNKNVLKIADKISKQIDADVIDITTDFLNKDDGKSITLYDVSPGAFLGYIKKAELIITPTFHATAFSVIFNRPFYFVKLGNIENTRVGTLLNIIGLKNRIINETEIPTFSDIDYSKAGTSLKRLKDVSIDYLKSVVL